MSKIEPSSLGACSMGIRLDNRTRELQLSEDLLIETKTTGSQGRVCYRNGTREHLY